jgi:DNA helicase-2/ATP-dependent DNA helicase PcrA
LHRWDDPLLDTEAAAIISGMLARLDNSPWHEAEDPMEFLRDAVAADQVQDPWTRQALTEGLEWCHDLLLEEHLSPKDIRARIRVGDGSTLLTTPGVHLLTGHIGKGQQFDWVVVVGAEEGCIPDFRSSSGQLLAEEARVFAVMLSRARHGVLVFYAREGSSAAVAFLRPGERHAAPASQHRASTTDGGTITQRRLRVGARQQVIHQPR